MKILASIDVEEIDLGHGLSTWRSEVHEVEVVRVVRYPVSRKASLNRWRYVADIKDHPALASSVIRVGFNDSVRVAIVRTHLNPHWKPPVFGPGVLSVEIAQDQAS